MGEMVYIPSCHMTESDKQHDDAYSPLQIYQKFT